MFKIVSNIPESNNILFIYGLKYDNICTHELGYNKRKLSRNITLDKQILKMYYFLADMPYGIPTRRSAVT